MATTIDEFCNLSKIGEQKRKIDSVILLMWFHQRNANSNSVTIRDINKCLIAAHLPEYNTSRLSSDLKTDKRITKGDKGTGYKLNRTTLDELNKRFGHLFDSDFEIKERVSLNSVPFLTPLDVANAHLMAQIYLLIYCFENSVRKLIVNVLNLHYGVTWWDKVQNAQLEKKVQERVERETKQKWISQRGENTAPLFYLDWSDLLKIIRKEESLFLSLIPDLKFIELRFEELERVRNIIAHNGFIPDQNDIDRLVLYFRDWIKQISAK